MGVCAGLGRGLGIDPVVFRIGFVVLLFGSGMGLFLYIAAFLLMKEPSGRPGLIEQWTRRDFDADTVMALLTAVLAFGLAVNLMTVWIDAATLVAAVFLAVALLAAHSHGVDLLGLARSMPERLGRRRQTERPAASYTETPAPPSVPSQAPPEDAAPPAPDATTPAAAVPSPQTEPTPQAEPTPAAAVPSFQPEPPEEPEPKEETDRDEAPADGPSARPEPVSPDAVTAEHRIQQEPTAHHPAPPAADHVTQGAPFAPNGPYQPLDPRKRAGYSPYDPALYDLPRPRRQRRQRRPKSYIGGVTLLLAIIVGGIVVAAQSSSAAGVSPSIVGGAMLITVGAGLLVAAWWGRGAGLVALGSVLTLLVGLGLMLGGVPRNVGSAIWTPVSVAEATRTFDVGVGDGRLDLTELHLRPGATVTLNAVLSVGELEVIVPPTARVEVHATSKVGDIRIDQQLMSGLNVQFDRTLEPEVEPEGEPATIVLNLKGGVSDMEVRRGA